MINEKKLTIKIKEYFKMLIDKTDDDVDCILDYNKQICNIIEEQPKVGEWILCSERLPKEDTSLRVYATLEHIESGYTHTNRLRWFFGRFENLNGSNISCELKVIAWMEEKYPEPYKGE